MAKEDTQHRLLRYLNDAHATEEGGLVALQDIADRAKDPEVKRIARDLAGVARTQIDRLRSRIEALGGQVQPGKNALNAGLAKGHRLANAFHDKADKHTQDVIKAYTLSHFEVGMYTSLKAYADGVGDAETTALAEALAGEEREAADRLLALVPDLAVVPATRKASRPGGSGGGGGMSVSRLAIPALAAAGAALALWGVVSRRR